MKIGDVVYSTKIRPEERAKIVDSVVTTKIKETKKGKKKEVRTKYIAKFNDGSHMTFYGFDINRSVFRVENVHGQMTMEDFM